MYYEYREPAKAMKTMDPTTIMIHFGGNLPQQEKSEPIYLSRRKWQQAQIEKAIRKRGDSSTYDNSTTLPFSFYR